MNDNSIFTIEFSPFLPAIAALPICFLLTKIIIRFSRKIKFLDYPNPITESHNCPIPYGGGIAIGITIIISLLFQIVNFHFTLLFIFILLPILIAGILDDMLAFSPFTKLISQIVSAIPLLLFLLPEPSLIIPLLILFIVFFQNAWNLIDIMDGLTASISFFIFFATGIILLAHVDLQFYSLLSFIISFSVLGFWILNITPAKIFLGETGTLLLGSLFAYITINVFLINKITAFFILLLGIIPSFELIFLLIIRIQKGIPFYRGSPDHFALRLRNNGFSIKSINNKIILFSLIYSALDISASVFFGSESAALICAGISIILIIIFFFYFKSLPARNLVKQNNFI